MDSAKKAYSLLLINPKRKYRFNWDLQEVTQIMGKKTVGHPLALPLLAAFTPKRYDVRIIDEALERIPAGIAPDLVGITGLVSNIRRGYELADAFRRRGIKVVMGGPEVTFNTEQALAHADSVVAGEAENVWEGLLEDFEAGRLARVYRAETPCAFERSPVPRWDLLDTAKMLTFSVQVSRGCPNRCDFCLVRKLFGKRHRYRDIDNVIDEINALPPDAQIAFADDNLTADKRYSRELMNRLIPLNRPWSCQASFEVTQDPELLQLMAQAGCNTILVGFETLNPASLAEAHKPQNKIPQYASGIENAHRAGIHILASFVTGFESDTAGTFDEIYSFTQKTQLSFVMISALNPYPGTDLYERMKAENRLTPVDPDLCNGLYPTMHHRHILQAEMFTRIIDTLDRVYAFENLLAKGPKVLSGGGFNQIVQPVISTRIKLKTMGHLLFRYLLSPNRYKRRLLLTLIGLIRRKRVEIGAVMQYLLFLSAIHGYLAFNKKQRDTVVPALRENDRRRPLSLGTAPSEPEPTRAQTSVG